MYKRQVEDRRFTAKVLVGVFAKVTEPVQLNVVVNVVVVSPCLLYTSQVKG